MIVTPHNKSEPETIGLSAPCGGGNFSLIVGMSFDETPMKAAATPAAPFIHVPICNVPNHTFNAAGLRRSSLTRKPNATIKTPLAVNSRFDVAITEEAVRLALMVRFHIHHIKPCRSQR